MKRPYSKILSHLNSFETSSLLKSNRISWEDRREIKGIMLPKVIIDIAPALGAVIAALAIGSTILRTVGEEYEKKQ